MARRALRAGLVGVAGGALVSALALPVEIAARGLPLRGALMQVQTQSVAIWVVESLPLIVGFAMYALARRGEELPAAIEEAPPATHTPPPAPRAATPPPVAPVARAPASAPPPPPPPPGLATVAPPMVAPPAPPPLPPNLVSAQVLSTNLPDHRVHALQELLKSVREQADRSEKESRQKSRTVAQMAHELRTPLAAIIGHAELLEEDGADLGAERLGEVRKIVRSARHLSGLVNEILDLSKLEIGALALVLEDVDLAQVVDEVRVIASPLAEKNENRFGGRVTPGSRFARGDHMRVRQVLVGLVANAFRITKGGNVTLTVEAATESDGWIAARVRDNGAGMSPDELERLFDGTSPQIGLGVSIARRLVELMGGRIDVESTVGKGTTFSVLLPPASRREADVAPRSTIALNERLAGMSLLIVDAEAVGVTLLRYLERAGMVVRLVTDLQSADLAVRSENPQLVLIDVGLPDAWNLVEELVSARVRVVATSVRDEDVERALETGVTAFLVRPLERRLVLATLERCLE
jgi:nitrogen-specific signal transduction histidine kinase/CheY-like chemotaxis protein